MRFVAKSEQGDEYDIELKDGKAFVDGKYVADVADETELREICKEEHLTLERA